MQIKRAVKYSAYQDLLALISGSAVVQLTIFADGVARVRPLVIFRGKGLRITRKEQEAWDRRVQVAFQPKAWCDDSMMKKWILEQ